MSEEASVQALKIGETFNETDDDVTFKVVGVRPSNDPPIALANRMKQEEDESSGTEVEYALSYVQEAVHKRRQFERGAERMAQRMCGNRSETRI